MGKNLQPVILYENHYDQITLNLVKTDLKNWAKKGYKVLLVELDKSYTIDEHLSIFDYVIESRGQKLATAVNKNDISYIANKIFRDEIIAYKNMLLEAQVKNFKIVPIDPQLMEEAANLESAGDTEGINKAAIERDKYMADKILEYSNKYNGKVIGIFGSAHYDLQKFLETKIAQNDYNIKPMYFVGRATDSELKIFIDQHPEYMPHFYKIEDFFSLTNNDSRFPYGINVIEGSIENTGDLAKQLDSMISGANKAFYDEL